MFLLSTDRGHGGVPPQLWKNYLSAKHICQTFKKNVKMLHIINLGPPGTGKSYLFTILEMMTPDGVIEAVTHVSDQRNFSDLAHIEENTSIVNTYDEARHDMLGTARRGDRGGGGNYVENSTSSRWAAPPFDPPALSVSPLLMLCTLNAPQGEREQGDAHQAARWLGVPPGVQGRGARAQTCHRGGAGVCLCSALYPCGSRPVLTLGVYHQQVPQLVNMNNYYNMADAVRSRYSGVPCYPFLRLDKSDMMGRVMDDTRTTAGENHGAFFAALYVLQSAFLDTMQGTGMCVPVAEEGWAAFSSRFEETLVRQFPYATPEGFVLKRVMDDAFQYCRMITNFTAIYLTFGHPEAPYSNLSQFAVEALRHAERCTVPSDEAMVLAISMVEEDIFPVAERDVLVEAGLLMTKLSEKNVPDMDYASSTHEVSGEILKHEILVVAGLRIEGDEAGQVPRPPEGTPPAAPPRPWRSFSTQYHRLKGLVADGDNNMALPCKLPALNPHKQDVDAILAADEYVVLCEANCHEPNDMYRMAAAELHPRLCAKESRKKPEEHIETVLRCLNKRTVRSSGGVPSRVVRIERVESSAQGRHRLVVHKAALDEAAENRMSIQAVLNAMAHRFTRPGNYLLNRPFPTTPDAYLPQLPDVFSVGLHDPKCAIMDVAAAKANVAAAKAAGNPFPWADARCTLGCTCFRKKDVFVTQGVSIPMGVRSTLQASLGMGDLGRVGMANTSRKALNCPFDEIGWRAHVVRLMGKEWDKLSAQEKALLEPAHPRSTAWTSSAPASKCYPFSEALHTLKERIKRARTPQEDEEEEEELEEEAPNDRWKERAELEVAAVSKKLAEMR